MKIHVYLLVVACVLIASGCRSVSVHRDNPGTAPSAATAPVQSGTWHSIVLPPRSPDVVIRTRDKFNPLWWFKNADDPLPPEWYRPGEKHRVKLWYCRNSLHNFMFFVIGTADKETVRAGLYPKNTFKPGGGWNFAFTRYKFFILPYMSYEGRKIKFYAGWRPHGNLGFKFNVKRAKKDPQKNL